MLLKRQTILFLMASGSTLIGCRNATRPTEELRTQVVEVTPAPATTSVTRQGTQIVIRGSLLATCAPYGLSAAAEQLDGALVITLTAAVAGNVCPMDVVWTKGYRVTVTGAPAEVHMLRVVHAPDLPVITPQVIHEGPITP